MKIIKQLNKLLLIIVIFLMVFNNLESVFSMSEEELKSTATNGDIYNPQLNTLGTSTTITGHNYANGTSYENLDVEVQKVVNKTSDEGIYNIEFLIRGKEGNSMTVSPTYVVFVIDKSYSMGYQVTVNGTKEKRWVGVSSAISAISTELAKINGVEMSAIGFSGGKASSQKAYDDLLPMRDEFASTALTSDEIGNYETDNQLSGATNIQAGLLWAQEKLKTVEGNKYIIMIGDGVPTVYYDENGMSIGTGNSNTQEKLDGIPAVMDATKSTVDSVKADGIEIFSIGYYLDAYTSTRTTTYNGQKYNEYMFATEMIQYIATNEHYYFQVDTGNTDEINNALNEIKNNITLTKAGYNPIITDNIGSSFKLVGSNEYGGVKKLTTESTYEITDDWQSLGNFNVEIDKASPTGWYETNANFNVTYYDSWGNKKIIDVSENPEVYWGHNVKLCETFLKEDKHQFNFHITGQNYDSWINLNENTCQTLYLSPGTYTITEVLDKEITLDSINGISNNGGQLIVETGNSYTIEFINNYDKKNYFHLNGNVVNVITNGGN